MSRVCFIDMNNHNVGYLKTEAFALIIIIINIINYIKIHNNVQVETF